MKLKYLIFLLFCVLISYGQLVLMTVWQDDNGLFFKLAHLGERAGYLGPGPFGVGAYKYIVTPFIPIYRIFGYNEVSYFVFSIFLYLASAYLIYFLFQKLWGKTAGRLAGFLYAAGYLASDGFIRFFNTAITSVSILLISFLTYFYYRFWQKRNPKFYFLAVLVFFLAQELCRNRAHYLIGVIFLFEIIFFFSGKISRVIASLVRLLPFSGIFYFYYLLNPDQRSGQIKAFILSIFQGNFFNLFGFFSSLTNLVVPDWITRFNQQITGVHWLLVLIILALILRKKILIIPSLLVGFFWIFISRKIFTAPVLAIGQREIFLGFLGGIVFLTLFLILPSLKKLKREYLFFLLWLLLNIAAYSAYNPTVIYESINRYLAHSFFAFVGLLTILYLNLSLSQNLFNKVGRMAIILWGVGNLIAAFNYQSLVVKNRSRPVKLFYSQLKKLLPEIKKGNLLYFDVADNARGYFADAFSVASMPETTAIAWRYGIDRYDFYLAENYDDFVRQVEENNIPLEKIHTFFYSKETGLVSTTAEFKTLSRGFSAEEEEFDFKNSYSCVLRPTITLTLVANPDLSKVNLINQTGFPFSKARAYAREKKNFYDSVKVFTSSNWRERMAINLVDQNPDTVWQADRVTWDKEKTFLGFDLNRTELVNKLVWINGYGNNTPTAYSVEVSRDKESWEQVAMVKEIVRIDDRSPREITFAPVKARYIRMVIRETLNSDSAGIAEAWVVSAGFTQDKITDLESYLVSPVFRLWEKVSEASLFWESNAATGWQTNTTAKFELIADGQMRNYRISVPCRGTELKRIKLNGFQFPLNLTHYGLKVTYSPRQ